MRTKSAHVFLTGAVPGVAVSGTTVYTSIATQARMLSYVVTFTGTMTGALVVQVSNSTDEEIAAGTDVFVAYSSMTTAIPAITAAVTLDVELVDMSQWSRVRLQYTNATNSGTIFARVAAGRSV